MGGRVIVTGGAGYIGAHVSVALLNAGHEILVIDNYANSSPVALDRIEEITGRTIARLEANLADAEDRARIVSAVRDFNADSAIHLAGLKAVGESVAEPMRYYQINIDATFTLLEAMAAADAKRLVFSSSATVYGDINKSPIDESGGLRPTNPYGRTKLFIETILTDHAAADPDFQVANLRYFNPVGAHPSGRIGEDPNGPPNNLFPYIAQVAVGRREKLNVFGNDYPTTDGTGVRDYIHVVDLADGHVRALDHLNSAPGVVTLNLGTGEGYSVLEAVAAFKRASNREIPFEFAPRRDGDVATMFANPKAAAQTLGWKTTRSLDQMCADHWNWQQQNPNGYGD
ncbi:MAG: UDP-glucose 4-epimerase GalE [Pseudomonadota bacterium]